MSFWQYFSDTFPTLKEQLKFEETLFRKTHKANGWYWNSHAVQLPVLSVSFSPSPLSPLPFLAEIIIHDGVTAVYRSNVDLFFYVLGAQGENEVKF